MRVIAPDHRDALEGVWTELAGPFDSLSRAEAYIDAPPPELGDPGTVSIERRPHGWYVVCYEP